MLMQNVVLRVLGLYFNILSFFSRKKAGKQAFNVFCYPFKTKLKDDQQTKMNALERFKVSFDGIELQCYKWGSGKKKVLCIHGWQSNAYRWKKFGEELSSKGFEVYAFDAPGHGASGGKYLNIPLYAGAIKSVLDEMGMADLILTHSLGGLSTMHLVNAEEKYTPSKLAVLGIPGQTSEFVDLYAGLMKMNGRSRKALRDYFKERIPYPIEHFSVYNYGPQLTCEGLIIHDENDKDAPVRHAIELSKLWRNSKLTLTKGFGHKMRDISVVNNVVEFFSK